MWDRSERLTVNSWFLPFEVLGILQGRLNCLLSSSSDSSRCVATRQGITLPSWQAAPILLRRRKFELNQKNDFKWKVKPASSSVAALCTMEKRAPKGRRSRNVPMAVPQQGWARPEGSEGPGTAPSAGSCRASGSPSLTHAVAGMPAPKIKAGSNTPVHGPAVISTVLTAV